jgi:hypothetical protein
VGYDFLVDDDVQSYQVNIDVNVGIHSFVDVGTPKPIEDVELKTQLKYAMEIKELDKMIDDAFEVIELLTKNGLKEVRK